MIDIWRWEGEGVPVVSFHVTLRFDQTIFKVLRLGGLDERK
jgi:hypothetical protein